MTDLAIASFLIVLEERFILNQHLHSNVSWNDVKAKLLDKPEKIKVLYQMELSGGEPDVVYFKSNPNALIYCD